MTRASQSIITAHSRGYRVTECGKVTNPQGEQVNPWPNQDGYYRFSVKIGTRSMPIAVHRLQAFQTFGAEIFGSGIECRHLDSDKANNSKSNIAIGNHSQNMRDMPAERLRAKAIHASRFAVKHNHSEVLAFYRKCKSYTKTAKHFGIKSKGTISFVVRRSMTAQHLGPQIAT